MPSDWAFIITYAILFVFAVYNGFLIGQAISKRYVLTAREYWIANILGVVIMVVASMFTTSSLVHTVILGLLPGYVVGLKMTFGESTGPWKALDRFFNVNASHRRRAASGTGDELRRRRKAGEDAPDLISVDGSKKGKSR
ncbi:MAG: hypothetical protein SOU51_04875 [Collinsella sp.]|nr:hypothetical protein [Collinsella sp.]